MGTDTVVWIVVAVVVVLLAVLLLAFVARGARDRKRAAEADRIRDEVREENARVEKREAIAAETEAKARAAAADAEAKVAEAARLRDRAAAHRGEAASSRERLDAQSEHADSIDPRLKGNGSVDDQDVERRHADEHSTDTDNDTEVHGEANRVPDDGRYVAESDVQDRIIK